MTITCFHIGGPPRLRWEGLQDTSAWLAAGL